MAVAVAGVNNLTGSGSTANLPKTGITVGELLVVGIVCNGTTSIGTPTTGWTEIASLSVNTDFFILYKIATAGETGAGTLDFTFTSSPYVAWIMRVTGHDPNTPVVASQPTQNTSNSSPHILTGITPAANSLLVLAGGVSGQAQSGTYDGYSITTSNPSWTERVDVLTTLGNDAAGFMATALRPEATATGNASVTPNSARQFSGIFLAIQPVVVVSADGTHSILTSAGGSIFPHTISVGTSSNHTILTMNSEIIASHSGGISANRWTKDTRGSKMWTKETR
jgi:hypothetical protein